MKFVSFATGTDDNSPCAEEPDKRETLMSGSEVAVGLETAPPTTLEPLLWKRVEAIASYI